MSRRVLVAGVGNVFLGDDGFGVEVVQRLAKTALPDGVRVVDTGIRGVHLAYELLDGYDALILVDAAPGGEPPGSLFVLEPEIDTAPDAAADLDEGGVLIDAHTLDPAALLRLVARLGGIPPRVLVVACEPSRIEEHMGLSAPVEAAVGPALALVRELVASELALEAGRCAAPESQILSPTGKEAR